MGISTHLNLDGIAKLKRLAEKKGMRLVARCAMEVVREAKQSLKGGGSNPETHVASQPGSPPNTMHGILKNSIMAAQASSMSWIAGPTNRAPYGRILEFGGIVRPRKARALAMPVHKLAFGRSPRDFRFLRFIPSGGAAGGAIGFLIGPESGKITAGGRRERSKKARAKTGASGNDVIFYVLLGRAVIAPRPYMRPAFMRVKDRYAQIAGREQVGFAGAGE